MKFAIAALVLICSTSFASGPSYHKIEVDISATETRHSDILACQEAKSKALSDALREESSSRVECESDVAYSTCQCQGLKTGHYQCTYTGAVICTEEVWYP